MQIIEVCITRSEKRTYLKGDIFLSREICKMRALVWIGKEAAGLREGKKKLVARSTKNHHQPLGMRILRPLDDWLAG